MGLNRSSFENEVSLYVRDNAPALCLGGAFMCDRVVLGIIMEENEKI